MKHRTTGLVAMTAVVAALAGSVAGGQQDPASTSAILADAAEFFGRDWDPPRTGYEPKLTPWGHPDLQGTYVHPPVNRRSRSVDGPGGVPTGDGSLPTGDGPEHWYENAVSADGTAWEWDRPVYPVFREPLVYKPWAQQKREYIKAHENQQRRILDPIVRCLRRGVPRTNDIVSYVSVQFMQTPDKVVMFYEWNHDYRIIRLDGDPHVGADLKLWMGDARGFWDGDTLVVDNRNFNDKSWIGGTGSGNFHSDDYRVIERYTPLDEHQIYYEAVVVDPNVLEKPWRKGNVFTRVWQYDRYEQLEFACHEGNKAVDNILDGAANLALPPGERR